MFIPLLKRNKTQNVSYGTIVNVRQVQIQGGDDSNVIGAIGGAVLGGFWEILLVAEPGVLWLLQQGGPLQVV